MVQLLNRNNFAVFIGEGLDTYAIPPQGSVSVKKAPKQMPDGVVELKKPTVARSPITSSTSGGK